jgi:hypothetical protein
MRLKVSVQVLSKKEHRVARRTAEIHREKLQWTDRTLIFLIYMIRRIRKIMVICVLFT